MRVINGVEENVERAAEKYGEQNGGGPNAIYDDGIDNYFQGNTNEKTVN